MAVPFLVPRVSLVCRHPDGQNMVNVLTFGVSMDTTIVGYNKDDMADDIFAVLGADLAPNVATTVEVSGCYVNDIVNPAGIAGKSSSAAIAGALAGDVLPSQVAAVVSLTPVLANFRRKGRNYWGGATENENTSAGKPSATHLTALKVMVDGWIAGVVIPAGANSFTITLGMWSRTLMTSSSVAASRPNTSWCTQRRRSGANRGDQIF